jgi:hypothetical protein
MGQRPAEKQGWLGHGNVHGIGHLSMQEEGLTNMVEQHEQNHHASQCVNGRKPASHDVRGMRRVLGHEDFAARVNKCVPQNDGRGLSIVTL